MLHCLGRGVVDMRELALLDWSFAHVRGQIARLFGLDLLLGGRRALDHFWRWHGRSWRHRGRRVDIGDERVDVETDGVEDLGLGHRLRVEQVARLEGRVRHVRMHFGQVVANRRVMHAAVRAPAAVVGLHTQMDTQVHLEIRLARAYLAALAAHPLGLVEVDGADVVVEVGEVGEYLVAVFAHRYVLLLILRGEGDAVARLLGVRRGVNTRRR